MVEGTIAQRFVIRFNVAQMFGQKPRKVKVVKTEGMFVLIEELELPFNPRRWVPSGGFFKVPSGLPGASLPEAILVETEA